MFFSTFPLSPFLIFIMLKNLFVIFSIRLRHGIEELADANPSLPQWCGARSSSSYLISSLAGPVYSEDDFLPSSRY
jgi:hypothetical protein